MKVTFTSQKKRNYILILRISLLFLRTNEIYYFCLFLVDENVANFPNKKKSMILCDAIIKIAILAKIYNNFCKDFSQYFGI